MKFDNNNKTINPAMARPKITTDLISYREVITEQNGEYFLLNVNILLGNKTIEKIRFKPGEKPYQKDLGKRIVSEYLEQNLIKNKKTKKPDKKGKKVNKKAKQAAAEMLFSEMGL